VHPLRVDEGARSYRTCRYSQDQLRWYINHNTNIDNSAAFIENSERSPLKNVFYVQSSVNPGTKQTTNVLVKRRKELHLPNRMHLNPRDIILVEPVDRF
jgi:hypothetical protein